jgi:hypothetical protein
LHAINTNFGSCLLLLEKHQEQVGMKFIYLRFFFNQVSSFILFLKSIQNMNREYHHMNLINLSISTMCLCVTTHTPFEVAIYMIGSYQNGPYLQQCNCATIDNTFSINLRNNKKLFYFLSKKLFYLKNK